MVGDDFLGLCCDQKNSYKLASNCEELQNHDHLKYIMAGKVYWKDVEKVMHALSGKFNI